MWRWPEANRLGQPAVRGTSAKLGDVTSTVGVAIKRGQDVSSKSQAKNGQVVFVAVAMIMDSMMVNMMG